MCWNARAAKLAADRDSFTRRNTKILDCLGLPSRAPPVARDECRELRIDRRIARAKDVRDPPHVV